MEKMTPPTMTSEGIANRFNLKQGQIFVIPKSLAFEVNGISPGSVVEIEEILQGNKEKSDPVYTERTYIKYSVTDGSGTTTQIPMLASHFFETFSKYYNMEPSY